MVTGPTDVRRVADPRGTAAVVPASITAHPLPTHLYDYGLVSDLETAALISRFGSIDWACMPHFSFPSVFGRLLDASRGGYQALRPSEPFTSYQRYVPSTNVLVTTFDLPGPRRLELVDFMPFHHRFYEPAHPRIVRIARAEGGPIPVQVSFNPRFDYGRQAPVYEQVPGGHVARSSAGSLFYRISKGDVTEIAGVLETSHSIAPGRALEVELGWEVSTGSKDDLDIIRSHTEDAWREWAAGGSANRNTFADWTVPAVERSSLLLKALTSRNSGAFVAAPTTSLPEWPGGSRNWDYRFSWIRDAAFSAEALILTGHLQEARSFLRWAIERSHATPDGQLRVVYRLNGDDNLPEEVLDHLAGFQGARPVRVGNAATGQFQLDIYGSLLNLAYMMRDHDAEYLRNEWPHLSGLANRVVELWREPDQGIWEMRGPAQHYVYSKVMAWVALDRAARLSEHLGVPGKESWRTEAALLRAEILEKGYDVGWASFVQSYGRKVLDASALRIPLLDFLPFSDPKVLNTIRAIDTYLADGPFIYRYRAPDGIKTPEGAFLLCSFWMVECLARSGDYARARARWDEIMATASPLGLFSEEIDPVTLNPLGNYPQAFTHIGVIRAALALSKVAHESVSK